MNQNLKGIKLFSHLTIKPYSHIAILMFLFAFYLLLFGFINITYAQPMEYPTPPKFNIGTDYSVKSPVGFSNIGQIISKLLPFIFVIAGLILFFLIVFNGLKFLTSAGNPKNIEAAKQGTVAALIGFILILASYWLIQIAEYIFHIKILGP